MLKEQRVPILYSEYPVNHKTSYHYLNNIELLNLKNNLVLVLRVFYIR